MSKGKFALGALIGGAIGAVTALLTAPKSGKETRDNLKKKVDEIKTDAEKKAGDVKKQAETVTKDVEKHAEELRTRAENAVQGAKDGFSKDVNKK